MIINQLSIDHMLCDCVYYCIEIPIMLPANTTMSAADTHMHQHMAMWKEASAQVP